LARGLGLRLALSPDEMYSDDFLNYIRSRAAFQIKTLPNSVVLHIRRGDVSASGHPGRFTDISYYTNIIDSLAALDNSFCFTVHAESINLTDNDTGELLSRGVKLSLDQDLCIAWQDMMNAELLCIAKSSFSYVPALYSRGVIIYQPFWHPKKSDWMCLRQSSVVEVYNRILSRRLSANCI